MVGLEDNIAAIEQIPIILNLNDLQSTVLLEFLFFITARLTIIF